ncbi:phosphoribosylformylglycinamidine cyclo-ligase [Sedimentisphaera salicampi]|uniref:Phosphoribosylformylglycinamidine cyclo-ligase n=1 Tax=Sedimentisphaera salicampi TaxID=1941349 RepID=A0A1W6LM68_9BACT|nr:phosphoribosylformylglycinamidine cyclo-ligase [Sedimentisphaera salicampi]ARN56890.1 Phosphoribosylformylglycinamidine cyclo-ligase [Sedimentisphaera salicampi]
MSDYLTYQSSGVNIEANDEMVEKIKGSVGSTFGPRVMDLHGGFAGLFSLENSNNFSKNYKNPVLVSCTDGVGTKVMLARDMCKFDTVGQDLVAMSVNDMIVLGAAPLFFLDYLAADELNPEKVAVLVEGIAAACREAGCSLIGGETAEMPGIYSKNDFDMAGFAVGVVEKDEIIKGDSAEPGDVIIGLSSSGVHSNGYSLVRNICFNKAKLSLDSPVDSLGGRKLGEVLLEPTKLYVQPVLAVLEELKAASEIKAMAHITGGGLVGNIPRVLPEGTKAVIKRKSWEKPDIFPFLQKTGPVEESEMYRVFNMGVGFVMVVSPEKADKAVEILTKNGQQAWQIGEICKGSKEVVIQ